MTLRPLLALVTLLVAPAALAATAAAQPGSETTSGSAATAPRTTQTTRKVVERTRPGTPLSPRVIEAPGAALMMIPASYDPSQNGPFSPL